MTEIAAPAYAITCAACASPKMMRVTGPNDHPCYWCESCREFSIEDTSGEVTGLRSLAHRPDPRSPMTPLALRDVHLLGPRGRFAVINAIFLGLAGQLSHKPDRKAGQ